MAELNESIPSPQASQDRTNITKSEISLSPERKLDFGEDIDFKKLQETHRHEMDMMKYGRFGKLFGTEENSSKALTFTTVLVVIIAWVGFTIGSIWVQDLIDKAAQFFKDIIPVITLAFGYFFGKK